MRIRVKALDTRSIWYVDVDDDLMNDMDQIRIHVARALKCQYTRLDGLEITTGAGDPVLTITAAHRPQPLAPALA